MRDYSRMYILEQIRKYTENILMITNKKTNYSPRRAVLWKQCQKKSLQTLSVCNSPAVYRGISVHSQYYSVAPNHCVANRASDFSFLYN